MSTKKHQDGANGLSREDAAGVASHDPGAARMDAMLASEQALMPSSGFLAAVMERVEDEARIPEPIPFPWKRALPGFVVAVSAAGWVAVEFVRVGIPTVKTAMETSSSLPAIHLSAAGSAPLTQAAWVAMALGVSLASWLLARTFTRRSRGL